MNEREHDVERGGWSEQDRTDEPETGETPETVASDQEAELARRVEELQAQADEWLDKYRRSVAEFANYRKRQEREREQQSWRMSAEVMKKLLEPLDDLEMALASVPEQYADEPWVQGVRLIAEKIKALLADYKVEAMDAVGKQFDPYYHDAMYHEPSEEYPEGAVSEELRKGYLMDGQVLRHALVRVSSGPGKDSREED